MNCQSAVYTTNIILLKKLVRRHLFTYFPMIFFPLAPWKNIKLPYDQ